MRYRSIAKISRRQRGKTYKTIDAKGSVPALELDNGEVLTEGAAIVQYLADQKPDAKLAPPAGTMDRYRLQEWLNYIASEVHKSYAPLFNPQAQEEWKKTLRELLGKKLDFLESALKGKKYLMGDTFTVADAYLFARCCGGRRAWRWTSPSGRRSTRTNHKAMLFPK